MDRLTGEKKKIIYACRCKYSVIRYSFHSQRLQGSCTKLNEEVLVVVMVVVVVVA